MARSPSGPQRLLTSLAIVALVANACASSPTVPPTVGPLPSQSAAAPTPSRPAFADAIRVAMPTGGTFNPPLGPLTNAASTSGDDQKAGVINGFIHEALYRYDEHVKPVPSLARSCDPSADGLTITCHLIEATFQNGDPVTADDVAFTYRLVNANTPVESLEQRGHPDCVTNVWTGPLCLSDVLESATKVDDRTVAFRLKRPYAPFYTNVLPGVWIDSERVVRGAYDVLRQKLGTVAAADLAASATRLFDATGQDCLPLLQDAAQLAARAGLVVPDRAEYDYLPRAEFDACEYASTLGTELALASASSTATDEITAIALAYPELDLNRKPVGAGPYKLTGYVPGKELTVEAWSGYHGAPPATPRFIFRFYADEDAAAKAVVQGDADLIDLYNPPAFHQLSGVPTVRTGHPVWPGYLSMTYNVRPGQLFADLRLRQAVERCLDKPPSVAASSDGMGVPVYADVPPGLWAYDDKVPQPPFNAAAAKSLIESSGWTLGADGVYAKDGRRLAATLFLRTSVPQRTKFAAILSSEVRDCGMDLEPVQGDFQGNLNDLQTWPNHEPGTEKPFDLYLHGFSTGWDPLVDSFASKAISTEANPDGDNIGGFSDPRVDALLVRLETTYDLDARADLFRQYQEILAAEQPALFALNFVRGDAVAAGLRTVDGPIDLDAPLWMANPQRLVLQTGTGS